MEAGDVAEQAVRWAPGIGAFTVGVVSLLVAAVVLFDTSLDRVSVDGLADEGRLDRDHAGGDHVGGDGGATDGPGDDDGESESESDDRDDGDDGDRGDDSTPSGLASPMHVLVAGSDDRSVLTDEEQRQLSTGDAPGERTEALALVRIDPDRRSVDVLRFPRDLLVTRCDGTRGRINAAYSIGERDGTGGASCLVNTVADWTGIPIHHVVKIDFRGFVDVVEAVGGIEVSLDEPLRDRRAGLDVPAGCVRLDGEDALAFVRARHLDDDFGRIERQQQLIGATMDQVLTPSTLADPRRLGSLLTAAQRSLQFDDGLTARDLRSIAATVAGSDGEDLVTRTITGEVRVSEDGIAFLHADDRYAGVLFDAFAEGELRESPSDASEAERSDGPSRPGADGAVEGSGGLVGTGPGSVDVSLEELAGAGGTPDGEGADGC